MLKLNESRDGQRPTRWGPIVWRVCFVLLLHHKGRKKRAELFEFLKLFLVLLYCIFCRHSFNEFYDRSGIEYDSKRSLLDWFYELHEEVNRKLDKPAFPRELIEQVYLTDTEEEKYWQNGRNSPLFDYCLWCILYLAALNFPPTIRKNNAQDRAQQETFPKLLVQLPALVPGGSTREQLERCKPRAVTFLTRKQCFVTVYEWECAATGKSRFGSTSQQTADYFEVHFRS